MKVVNPVRMNVMNILIDLYGRCCHPSGMDRLGRWHDIRNDRRSSRVRSPGPDSTNLVRTRGAPAYVARRDCDD